MGIELEKKERDSFFKLYYITFTKFILLRKTLYSFKVFQAFRNIKAIVRIIHYEKKSLIIVNIYR